MDILSKQKFTNILIVILIVINIGCLSFIWYKEAHKPLLPPSPPKSPNGADIGRFLDKELNLNKEQEQKFDEFRKEHFETTRKFEDKIAFYKRKILSESFKQNPDMQEIKTVTDSIGSLQEGYELFLSEHFQKLASVCKPEQREKLKDIFLSSFRPKDKPPVPPPPSGGRTQQPGPPGPPLQ